MGSVRGHAHRPSGARDTRTVPETSVVENTATLVVETTAGDDIRRLGDWLTDAGLSLTVCRAHAGDPLPDDLTGYAALVVLGGPPGSAAPDSATAGGLVGSGASGGRTGPGARAAAAPAGAGTSGDPGRSPALERLLRAAVRHEIATLAVGAGAQALARAHGGGVAPAGAGPELGPKLVAKRDVAHRDPLWAPVPMAPDVLQWHRDEIVELPAAATLLAASTHYPHQAFRIGTRAWGIQFHIECDTAMVAGWVSADHLLIDELGYDPEVVVGACDMIMTDLAEAWQPFAARFAGIATGAIAPPQPPGPRSIPLLGG